MAGAVRSTLVETLSERARLVHEAGALVLYGRCDEDLGAPYQPFAEAFRVLLPVAGRGAANKVDRLVAEPMRR